MRTIKRHLGHVTPDVHKTFITENGKHYRGVHQEMNPVIQHVKDTALMVNNQSRVENPNGWRFKGSIPFTILIDWLERTPYTMELFAREPAVRKEFLKYFMTPEFSKFHCDGVGNRGCSL